MGSGCGGNGSDPLPQEPFLFDLTFTNATGNAELTPITTDRIRGHVFGSKVVLGEHARNHYAAIVAEDLANSRTGFDKRIVLNLNGPQLVVGDVYQMRFSDDLPADVGRAKLGMEESPLDSTEIEYPTYYWVGISGTVRVEALEGSVLRVRLSSVVLRGSELAEGTVELNGVIEVDYDQIPDEDPDHDPDAD
jgi:hypothetical protein